MPWFNWLQKKERQASQRAEHAATPLLPNVPDIYMLPKDFREVNRLDFQHYILRQALAGNYLAPLNQPKTILDVACGTGRWMAEMATEFPQAQVLGVDKTPLSLQGSSLPFPPNCRFQECDILQGLPGAPKHFDFVHQRFLVFALPLASWPIVMSELVRVTRPGGWIEVVDADLNFRNQGPETRRILHWIAQAGEKRGLDITIGSKLERFLQQAGLINITAKRVSVPMGNWGGRLGQLLAKDYYEANRTLKPLVTTLANVDSDEFDRATDAWLHENDVYQTACDFYVAYGQRPF